MFISFTVLLTIIVSIGVLSNPVHIYIVNKGRFYAETLIYEGNIYTLVPCSMKSIIIIGQFRYIDPEKSMELNDCSNLTQYILILNT
mgnify:FL=1